MSELMYTNPLVEQRADPWVYRHSDGLYYYTATVPAYDRIELRIADTLEGLSSAEGITVWEKHARGEMSALIWAPEIHFVQGKWYIYFAAAPTTEMHPEHGTFRHRMYVLEAEDPRGAWVEKGQIQTDIDAFCLDATVFENRGEIYYVWAQKDPEILGNSNIYIARMKNPWTLELPQVLLTKPEYPWECSVIPVNEGPAVIHNNGRIFLAYSANATGKEYCVGLLTADEDADLLDPVSWTKSPRPVFETSGENRKYGPGHNSFTYAEDGKTPVIVYHVRDFEEIVGDPLDNPDRHTCVQTFSFDGQNMPVFGQPAKKNR